MTKPLTEWQLKLQKLREQYKDFETATRLDTKGLRKYVTETWEDPVYQNLSRMGEIEGPLDTWHFAYALFLKVVYPGFPQQIINYLKDKNFNVSCPIMENDKFTLFKMARKNPWDDWRLTSITFNKPNHPPETIYLLKVLVQPNEKQYTVKIEPAGFPYLPDC